MVKCQWLHRGLNCEPLALSAVKPYQGISQVADITYNAVFPITI